MLSQKSKEKFERLYAATEGVRAAKGETIKFIGKIGRKCGIFKYPIFLLTVVFIFLYNLFLYAFIGMRMKEKLARALAMVMVAVMVITTVDVMAFAEFERTKPLYDIVYVAEPDEAVLNQTLPAGSDETNLDFPASLTVIAIKKQLQEDNTAPSVLPEDGAADTEDNNDAVDALPENIEGESSTINAEGGDTGFENISEETPALTDMDSDNASDTAAPLDGDSEPDSEDTLPDSDNNPGYSEEQGENGKDEAASLTTGTDNEVVAGDRNEEGEETKANNL